MTLLEKAVEKTGWAPETIRDKLCPSDLDLEADRYTIKGCEVLKELGSCRACWGREVESGRLVAAPTEGMESGPPGKVNCRTAARDGPLGEASAPTERDT